MRFSVSQVKYLFQIESIDKPKYLKSDSGWERVYSKMFFSNWPGIKINYSPPFWESIRCLYTVYTPLPIIYNMSILSIMGKGEYYSLTIIGRILIGQWSTFDSSRPSKVKFYNKLFVLIHHHHPYSWLFELIELLSILCWLFIKIIYSLLKD